jgi:hypothetical protein
MAGFKTHITTSCTLGAGYACIGVYQGLPIEAGLVAGGLCGIGGMLPDIDSDSGVPVRETMGLASAVTPMLLVDRFEHLGLNYEQIVLAAAATYLFVRFGIAGLLKRYTVHRGMFHSIPALLIFTGVAFLICGSQNLQLRYYKAGGVFIGVLSHLALDEIWAVDWQGGRWRFKSSFGTALKLWGESPWGNLSCYAKLAGVAMLILSEPSIMERYGQLTPIVLNNDAIRQRLNLPPEDQATPVLAQGVLPTAPDQWPAQFLPYARAPLGVQPQAQAGNQPDRTIYDTARRIWNRLAH